MVYFEILVQSTAWFKNGDRHLAGMRFRCVCGRLARSQSPFLNHAQSAVDMFRNAIRASRAYPITAGCIALCILLHLAVVVLQIIFSESEHDAFWHLGAIENLLIVGEPNLKGPFDLWDGEVWRIPVSTFHHGNFIHLVFNVLGNAFL